MNLLKYPRESIFNKVFFGFSKNFDLLDCLSKGKFIRILVRLLSGNCMLILKQAASELKTLEGIIGMSFALFITTCVIVKLERNS